MKYLFQPSAGNSNPPVDYGSSRHLPVEKKYSPPPEGRAPSPSNKDEGKPFFVPDCHHSDSVGNAHYIPKEVKVMSTFLITLHTVAV